MKLPRDVAADRLVSALARLGYREVRRKGSHLRLQHPGPPEHYVTVPLHNPIKVGTLSAILAEVAQARSVSAREIAEKL